VTSDKLFSYIMAKTTYISMMMMSSLN